MQEVYQNEGEADVIEDTPEATVMEGAGEMLAAALEEGVNALPGRDHYERGEAFRRYRYGLQRPV